MADSGSTRGRGLGGVLSLIGYAWIAVAIFGRGLLNEIGVDAEILNSFVGTVFPGFILVAIGRGMRRRRAPKDGDTVTSKSGPVPDQSKSRQSKPEQGRPVQTKPNQPARKATTVIPSPKPAKPAPARAAESERLSRDLEQVLAEMDKPEITVPELESMSDPADFAPKTSQEMLEEARKKWGSGSKSG